MKRAKDIIRAATREAALARDLKAAHARERRLASVLHHDVKEPVPIRVRRGKAARHFVRVVIPDSHGAHIDPAARDACLGDIAALDPAEIVWLGDHLDCGGMFSVHQRSYTKEMAESYPSDVAAANHLLDAVQDRAPNARHYYLFGNHEDHIERWAARECDNADDARFLLERIGPAAVLQLERRRFEVFSSSEMHHGLSVPGVIKLGKNHFTHGWSASKHAAATHLARAGENIVFGHVHRVQAIGERTLASDGYGAWCCGTLAKLQPLYMHTSPSSWQHGYAVEFVNASTGTFVHFNVPIVRGVSLLTNVVDALRATKKKGRKS